MANELPLRYGVNPHQVPARVYADQGLPFVVRNGAPGYINLLDALNAWQLVRELRSALGLPAAASFKHVSPAGAAIGLPLPDVLRAAYLVPRGADLSPLANAYARARGADRVCSYGDFVALSDEVDVATAQLLRREVSDGVIAPGYSAEAFELLKAKKGGRYLMLEVNPGYSPPELETREVFGVTFEQRRNDIVPGQSLLGTVVTRQREVTESAKRDMLIGMITLKYTQSNSVCLVLDGQVIGNGAGQQSRIHCTRLACDKADTWFLRQHPRVLGLEFARGTERPERDNAIDEFVREGLSRDERAEWLSRLRGVSLASDAFFPFRDNIDRARLSGVEYVVQPGGSARDRDVIAACDEYGMTMAFTGLRLFHH